MDTMTGVNQWVYAQVTGGDRGPTHYNSDNLSGFWLKSFAFNVKILNNCAFPLLLYQF